MADHTDDTILDDELDESEFNFDNEHEDALLAENEYDFLEKAKSTINDIKGEKEDLNVPKTEEEKVEPLEVEEDVLDIGIVDEDIVDQDTAYLQEDSLRNPVQKATIECNHSNNGIDEVDVCRVEPKGTIKESATSGLDELKEDVVPPISGDHEEVQNDKSPLKDCISNHDEQISKPSVISLRKSFKKSYDDVPDLAKVIESVQPGSASSRAHKIKRSTESFDRKRREGADGSYSKHNYEEKRRKEPPSYLHDHTESHDRKYDRDRDRHCDYERDRERDYDRDRSRDYDRGRSSYRENNSLSEGRSQVVPYRGSNESETVSFKYQQQFTQLAMQPEQNFQPNFPSSPVQYQQDQPIIASVQITQQRYDYVIRPGGPPPQVLNQPPPVNSFGQPTNQRAFFRGPSMAQPFPDTIRPPPPHPNVRMQSFPRQQHVNMRPPPPQGFRPPMHQMNQQPPSNHQSYMPSRGPPLHMQPPPPRPQLQSPQMVRQLGPPPQMRPQFRQPPPINVRPPQIEHVRPPNVQPAARFPLANERLPPPSIMGRPPPQIMHMPPPRNHFPADNGVRIGAPFRPDIPPPQSVSRPQAPPQAPAQYYDNRRHVIAATAPPTSYHQTVSKTYVTTGPVGQPPGVHTGGQNIGNTYSNVEVTYSQYPQTDYYPRQASQQYSDDQYANKEDVNPLKRNNSPIDVSPSKLGRYDYLDKRKDEDDELKRYRLKVEEQKKLRDQMVQQKEEQRLKNQMQNFIQSNIKGILEKREQFRRKNELETAKHSRESIRKPEPAPVESSRRADTYAYSSSDYRGRRSPSPVRSSESTQRSKDIGIREKDNPVRDRLKPPPVVRNEPPPRVNTQRPVERTVKKADSDLEADRGQLHKVLKITYKDGTVALKSIPVQSNNVISKSNTNLTRKSSHSSGNFEIRIGDDNSGHPNRRRMVVSKEVAVPNVNDELAENIIVESVRKAVPKSSIPLAQRFSNLRTTNRDEDGDSVSGAKSKNRLVIPDEDKTRTVLVKNIAASTNPALIQKMANTCGNVSHTNWIYGGGQASNQAKITFSKLEEAKKFCSNFHRKMIDVSMISVSMLSDAR